MVGGSKGAAASPISVEVIFATVQWNGRHKEAAGARVAPIPYDLPPAKFDALIGSLNGALITGGETDIKQIGSAYMNATRRLYDHSLALHATGEAWPLWGTCMGMQVLSILGANDPAVLLSHAYSSEGQLLPLSLTPAAASSRLPSSPPPTSAAATTGGGKARTASGTCHAQRSPKPRQHSSERAH
mgnify:CR=1 FL=1